MSHRAFWFVPAVGTAAVLLLFPLLTRGGGNSWKGKLIVPKKPGIEIGYTDGDGDEVVVGVIADYVLTVVEDKGGWLCVKQKQTSGWFNKEDALLLTDALPYLDARLKINPKDDWAVKCRKFVAAWIELGPPPGYAPDVPPVPLLKP